jgi:uncharacterized protein (DUF2345 family)
MLMCYITAHDRAHAKHFYAQRHGGINGGSHSSRTASGGVTSVLVGQYDEQVEAKRGASFEGYPYFIQTEDGRVFLGLVDSGQRLPRVPTETSENYTVFWGDDALARQEGN